MPELLETRQMTGTFTANTANFTPDTLVISAAANKPIIRIDPSGRLFWHEREVETDDDFRKAMLELMVFLRGNRP